VGGGTLIQTMVVVASVNGRFGVAMSYHAKWLLSNPPPTYVATLSSMRSVRYVKVITTDENHNHINKGTD